VQLKHIPTGIVVKSQATRSRSQNRKIARQILANKLELMERGDESRAAKLAERDRKRKASKSKKAKRKWVDPQKVSGTRANSNGSRYAKLDAEKQTGEAEDEDGEDGEHLLPEEQEEITSEEQEEAAPTKQEETTSEKQDETTSGKQEDTSEEAEYLQHRNTPSSKA
jgi:peptide chain release factor